jgi:hypothetical protein
VAASGRTQDGMGHTRTKKIKAYNTFEDYSVYSIIPFDFENNCIYKQTLRGAGTRKTQLNFCIPFSSDFQYAWKEIFILIDKPQKIFYLSLWHKN